MKKDCFTALLYILNFNYTILKNVSYNSCIVSMHVFAETYFENLDLLQNFIIMTQLN